MFRKIILFIVAIVLTVFFTINQPQMLALPLGLLLYTFRNALAAWFKSVSLSVAYVLTGFVLGIIIEIFAIWQNLNVPFGQRKLFNQDPVLDLLIAVGFYAIVSIALYLFVRRYNISKHAFIGITAFYAVVIEQLGQVFIAGFANPLIWLYVVIVYGVWTVTPYVLFYDRFPQRLSPTFLVYLAMLIVMWAASFLGSILGTVISKLV